MTRKEAISKFRRHWKWLAEDSTRKKGEFEDAVECLSECYLCEYCVQDDGCKENCEKCPIDWPGGVCWGAGTGLYDSWEHKTGEKASAIAFKIANLPERKEEANENRIARD